MSYTNKGELMSEENVVVSDNQETSNETVSNQHEDYVSKKAYEEVTKDMHKFKARAKEAAAAKAEYEAKLKAIEEEKLREQENWKALSENYKTELETLKSSVNAEKQRNQEIIRKNALKQELGGNIKDQYLSLVDLNQIEINEHGLPDKDSLLEVANKFREEHGVLIQSSKGGNPTSAPASPSNLNNEPTLDKMSVEDKLNLLKSMKKS